MPHHGFRQQRVQACWSHCAGLGPALTLWYRFWEGEGLEGCSRGSQCPQQGSRTGVRVRSQPSRGGVLQGQGEVCSHPSVLPENRRSSLFSRLGLGPISFAIHLLIRAVSSALPGHSAGHNKRHVPAPVGKAEGQQSPAEGQQHSTITCSKQTLARNPALTTPVREQHHGGWDTSRWVGQEDT